MTDKNRLSIDLKGLRERIESYRSDPAWKQLSLAGKVRALIQLALDQGGDSPRPTTIAQLIDLYWETITLSEVDISVRRIQEIRKGDRPTDEELVELATVLPYDTPQLIDIRKNTFGNGNGEKANGQPATRV